MTKPNLPHPTPVFGLQDLLEESERIRKQNIALCQLVRDCLKHMEKEPDMIVEHDAYGFAFLRDDWQHEILALQRRASDLLVK